VAYHVRTLASLGLIEHATEDELRRAMSAVRSAPGARVLALNPKICPLARVGSFEDERALATSASLRLDEAGWEELSQACTQLLEQADQIARSSAERMAQNPQQTDRTAGMVLFMFESTGDNGDGILANGKAVS